jgi:hypothetical protein
MGNAMTGLSCWIPRAIILSLFSLFTGIAGEMDISQPLSNKENNPPSKQPQTGRLSVKPGLKLPQTSSLPSENPRKETTPQTGDQSVRSSSKKLEHSQHASKPHEGSAYPHAQPSVSTSPSVTAVRLCNGDAIGFASTFQTTQPQTMQGDSNKTCISTVVHPSYPKDEILKVISSKIVALETRIPTVLKELYNYYPESILDLVANTINTKGQVTEDLTIDSLLAKSHLSPKDVRFALDLCKSIYFRQAARDNPNMKSTAYEQKYLDLKGRISRLKGRIEQIDEFVRSAKAELSTQKTARLATKKTEGATQKAHVAEGGSVMAGEHKQNVGFGAKQDSHSQELHHEFGTGGHGVGLHAGHGEEAKTTTSSEIEDVTVKTLKPELVKSFEKDYLAIFGTEGLPKNFESLTFTQLEDLLNKRKLRLEQELVPAERDLEIFSDPHLKDYWAKLETILSTTAIGYIPLDVFYRTTKSYSAPHQVLNAFAKLKENKTDPQQDKEISGVVLFKEGKPTEQNDRIVDQIYIAFSGSNSETDWKHNLDFFRQEGTAEHDIALGMRVHRGIQQSLNETLGDYGNKTLAWIKKYRDLREGIKTKKPLLRIVTTGHSLGGALALLMGLYVKQKVQQALENVADVEVTVITFGQPPIFNDISAEKTEKLLGKWNILRFWTIGDPVANLSLIFKDNRRGRSPIQALSGYHHIGISIPLFDKDQVGGTFDPINPWSYHLMNRYSNLLYNDWEQYDGQKLKELQQIMIKRNIFQDQKLMYQLEQLFNFIKFGTETQLKVEGLSQATLTDLIQKEYAEQGPVSSTIQNYDKLQDERFKQRIADPLQFKKVDLSTESPTVTYTHNISGHHINLTLNRSTSCNIDNLGKEFKFNPKSMLANDQSELSCVCCVVKNTFVSYGGGTKLHQARDVLRGKDAKTPASILNHCEEKKYCSNPEVKKQLFPATDDVIHSFGILMNNIGLKDLWLSKKVQ